VGETFGCADVFPDARVEVCFEQSTVSGVE
jgi:hypothetical protein